MKNKFYFIAIGLFISSVLFAVDKPQTKPAAKQKMDISKLVEEYAPVVPTYILDQNGQIVDTIGKERREIATIDEIPKNVQYAFVAIEDKRFFEHHGVDYLRTGKAVLVDISQMKKAQGGSTITQQLARNAFLTLKKKWTRKVQEIIIATEIERQYTKEEILEKYLNEIYFGSGAHGVKTAARVFFNKDIKKVNLAEAALLAGVPNNPTRYSPFENLPNAVKRQRLILKQMLEQKFITEKEYKEALNYKMSIKNENKKSYRAASFMTVIQKELTEKYKFTEKDLNENGMKIYTTIDVNMQKAAESAVNSNKYISSKQNLEAGFIAIDSQNGFVKAVVGGKNFRFGNFNRAINSKRLPGSSYKPFIYFTAINDNHFPMNMIIQDSAVTIGNWSPANYEGTYSGNVTMIEAIEKSINTVAVKLVVREGLDSIIANSRAAGITAKIPKDYSIALGTITLSPYELAKAYIPFSNGGYTVEPIFITRIEDKFGNIIVENKIKKERVFDRENVAQLVHIMKSAVQYGTGRAAYVGIEQAGKTGTTNDYISAWFAGFTPDLVTTMYVGYDNNKSMGSGMAGGNIAAPICGKFLRTIVDNGTYKPKRFTFIDNLVEDKSMVYKEIDLKNGLIADSSTLEKRTALFKSEMSPIENASKYSKGLAALLK